MQMRDFISTWSSERLVAYPIRPIRPQLHFQYWTVSLQCELARSFAVKLAVLGRGLLAAWNSCERSQPVFACLPFFAKSRQDVSLTFPEMSAAKLHWLEFMQPSKALTESSHAILCRSRLDPSSLELGVWKLAVWRCLKDSDLPSTQVLSDFFGGFLLSLRSFFLSHFTYLDMMSGVFTTSFTNRDLVSQHILRLFCSTKLRAAGRWSRPGGKLSEDWRNDLRSWHWPRLILLKQLQMLW